MILLKLILTNFERHRVRTLISIFGIAFSVAAMLTVVTILQGAVGMFSGLLATNSQVLVFERNVSDLFFSSVPDSAAATIAAMPEVDKATPVLFGVVSSSDHPIITCFGVTPEDSRIQDATWVSGQKTDFGAAKGEVVLGERAAEFLNAHQGEQINVGHGSFKVLGVIRTKNGFEDGGVFMPLTEAQAFFHKDGTSSIITVKLKSKDNVRHFKQQVDQRFPGLIALENQEFDHSYTQFKILKMTAWAVGGCGLLLGGLGVVNTMIMSVFTRIREIAILRVNGFSGAQVARIIFAESGLISILGALVGICLGVVAIFTLKLIPALHGYIDATLHPSVIIAVIVLAWLTGVAGALYPALYAIRIRAVEALRFE